MSTFLQDFRYALRSFIKTPALTLAVVLSLGLGIGANTTVFTWVQAVLLRPIPAARDQGSLYVAALEMRDGRSRSWSYPNYRDLRDRATLTDVIAQDDLPMSVAVNGQGERAFGAVVSGNYFQVLGIQPAAGRLFTADDDRHPGGHPIAVISHAYWLRRFGADSNIAGRQVSINNTPMTIVGVAEEGFLGSFLGVATAAFVPMAMQPQLMGQNRLEARGTGWMQTYVRLKPGVTHAQATSELESILRQIEREQPKAVDGWRIRAVRPWQAPFGAPVVLTPILGVLSVVVALVLLIACANVANLLLSRAVGRRREIAVRLSLGANRVRLIRQLLTEALLLALAAGAAGIAMTYWTSGLLMAFAPPTDVPIDFGLAVNAATFEYALLVSMLTGVFFGLAPAWQASKPDTMHALKEEGGRGSAGRSGQRLRGALVVAQVAVCLVLLVGASLFVRSLRAAQQIDLGFDWRGMVVASIDLFPNGYTPETGRQFHQRLTDTIGALPGVQSLALGRQIPLSLSGGSSTSLSVAGYTPQPNEEVNVRYNVVGPRYFETMRIPLIAGREFTPRDTRTSRDVVIINETMAKRYWSGREAVGGIVRIGKDEYEVAGIAKDIKYSSIAEQPVSHLYFALEQSYSSNIILHVRSDVPPGSMLAAIRDAVRTLDPNLPLYDMRTVEEHMGTAVFAQKMGANLLGVMGLVAVLLAAVGLYGVIAYAVSQRTRELGIRLALGAEPRKLLRMVMGHGIMLTSVGLAIGLALAFAATRFMRSLLPGITPGDPVTFIAVPLLLLAIAVAAAWIPARRAGAVDPVVALRYE